MGNLLPAALKGMFMQRLGADFELATCVARMVGLNGSQSDRWEMRFGFFKSVFFPDVKCILFPDWSFIICADKLFAFMQLWE